MLVGVLEYLAQCAAALSLGWLDCMPVSELMLLLLP